MNFPVEVTKIAFKFKVINQKVIKYSDNTFVAYFKFENGYHVNITLVEGRPEFKNIPFVEPNHNDIFKAKCLAAEQHLKLKNLFESKIVLYGRAKYKFPESEEYAISLYLKDDSSPTGVTLANMSCSDLQARGFGIFALSPTEDLRTAH